MSPATTAIESINVAPRKRSPRRKRISHRATKQQSDLLPTDYSLLLRFSVLNRSLCPLRCLGGAFRSLGRAPRRVGLLTVVLIAIVLVPEASAHGVSGKDALFLQSIKGVAIGPLMYLGAKHMVTGYDHLAFLVGVIFFLYRMKDVLLYVSLFTIGHSITLLAGVIGGIHANAFIVDAIIGLSVVYKAFENMGGFRQLLGWQPDTRAAVLIFGLCHGFGLATKLQEFTLPKTGLVANIVSFNVGVEIGQLLALTAVLIALTYWRTRPGFLRHAFVTNAALMTGGFLLVGYQVTGYWLSSR